MSEKYILYNPCAGGPETEKAVKALQDANEGAVAINICRIISYKTFFNGLDRMTLCSYAAETAP